MSEKLPEPWLRGTLAGMNPHLAPLFYSFQQAREDLALYASGLTSDELWDRPYGLASVGFHVRHIAGSVDRLITYARGHQLDESQLAKLRSEAAPTGGWEELRCELDEAFAAAEVIAQGLDLNALGDARVVGRMRLPTTMAGLLVHIAEHTQRHVGQAITTAKVMMARRSGAT